MWGRLLHINVSVGHIVWDLNFNCEILKGYWAMVKYREKFVSFHFEPVILK